MGLILSGLFLAGCVVVPTIILAVLIVTLRGKEDNTLAILSLITGILGLFVLPIVGGIAAIVSGSIALNHYKESLEANTGTNASLARAGVILGWIGLALWSLAVIGGILFLLPSSSVIIPGS